MADLPRRLRDAVDRAPPIDLGEVQRRRAVDRRTTRRHAALAGVGAGGLVAVGLLIAALTGLFTVGPTTRVTVGGPSSSTSNSATTDRVAVTVTLAQRTVRAGEPVRGHITFDNRTGHPFRNGDACSNEGLDVILVGHGVFNPVPSGAGCTHPYLLPNGTTELGFTVSTRRDGSVGPPLRAGRYRIEATLYPEGLPVPHPVTVVLTPASATTSATAHGIKVRLTLDTPSVPHGGTVRGRLTITTPGAIRGCPGEWFAVGFSSERTGPQLPGSELPLCATTVAPAGTSSHAFKQNAEYQTCTQAGAQATRDMPRCSGPGLPDLPPGPYQLKVEFFVAGLPTPAPIPLTITGSP